MYLQVCLSWLLATSITTSQIACRPGTDSPSSYYSSNPAMTLQDCTSLNLTSSSDAQYWTFTLPTDAQYRCIVLRSNAPYCLISNVNSMLYDVLLSASGQVAALTAYGVAIENDTKHFSITHSSTYIRLPSTCSFTVSAQINATTNFVKTIQFTDSVSTAGFVNSITINIVPLTNSYPTYFLYQNVAIYGSALLYTGATDPQYRAGGVSIFFTVQINPASSTMVVQKINTKNYYNGQAVTSSQQSSLNAAYLGTFSSSSLTSTSQLMSYVDWQTLLTASSWFPFATFTWCNLGNLYISVLLTPLLEMRYLIQNPSSASLYYESNPLATFGSYGLNNLFSLTLSATALSQTISLPGGSSLYFASLLISDVGVQCQSTSYSTTVMAEVNLTDFQLFKKSFSNFDDTLSVESVDALTFLILGLISSASLKVKCQLPSEIRYTKLTGALAQSTAVNTNNLQSSMAFIANALSGDTNSILSTLVSNQASLTQDFTNLQDTLTAQL